MKPIFIPILALAAVICLATSCKKEKTIKPPVTSSGRTLRFILYTNEDFHTDDHGINFSLHISDGVHASFDSIVYTAKVKDIPDHAHQLVFEKKVPDDGKALTVGFTYEIQNVGFSWHLDTIAANEKSKVIEYPFQ